MSPSRLVFVSLSASLFAGAPAACKKDEPAPPPAPGATAQVGTPLVMPDTPPGRTKVPPHLNPARNVKGQTLRPLGHNLTKLRPFAPTRATKIGKGTLSFTLEGLGPQSLPMNVYRRGRLIILSADRPDLGLVVTLPTLAKGRYARGVAAPVATRLPPPNLRTRLGVAHQGIHLQAADLGTDGSLTVDVMAAEGGAASGAFEGTISRGGGEDRRKLTLGRFDLQVDNALPGVAEVFSLEHAIKAAEKAKKLGTPKAAPAPASGQAP